MPAVRIRASSTDAALIRDIFGADPIPQGLIEVRPGITIEDGGTTTLHGAAETSVIVDFLLTTTGGVVAQVVGSWLYETLRGRVAKIKINDEVVAVAPSEIASTLEKEIKSKPASLF